MKATELIYSAHDRCEHIHRDWLVERALESWTNKTIFYLPMSSGAQGDQEYSWGTFSWYFDRFREYGLEPRTFMWADDLGREHAELFFDWLLHSEVVVLGGGKTSTGMDRYRAMGGIHFGDPDAFVNALRTRQAAGMLTAGFSAGADQLAERSCDNLAPMFGLVWKTIVRLHYEPAGEGHLAYMARENPDCLVFGLPNDSGLASACGRTTQGNSWQHLQFVVDSTWDRAADQHHIKTRWDPPVKIEHRYEDGRRWGFNGGDILLRVFYRGGGTDAWIKRPEVSTFIDYRTQRETHYRSIEEILRDR
jgi:hypothetical protein